MRQGVVLELTLRDVQCLGVRVRMTLVRIELMVRLLLVLLCPPTIGSIDATIDTGGITTNRCQATTLLKGRLANIHATRVTHTVRLTTTIFWAETILHEFLICPGSHLSSSTTRVSAMMTVDTWCRSIDVVVLGFVTVALESGGVL